MVPDRRGPDFGSVHDIKLDHGVDNMAMAMSLVASTRGLALMPAYAKNLLPWSVVSRPLEGEAPNHRSGRGLQQGKQLADSPALPLQAGGTAGADARKKELIDTRCGAAADGSEGNSYAPA
jgi:hypothetical protein